MRNKKFIAIALVIGIISSSFTGIIQSSAIDKYSKNLKKESYTKKAPKEKITELEVEVKKPINTVPSKASPNDKKEKEGAILYNGTKTKYGKQSDMYNFTEEDIDELIQEGYSIEDIFKADEIGNEICEDPKVLLKIRKDTNKSLEQIKEDILNERSQKVVDYFKKNYESEYDNLKKLGFKKEEINSLLAYIDINKIELTEELINEYKVRGDEMFKTDKTLIKEDTKTKYNISDKEEELLNEELIRVFEDSSEVLNMSVRELIDLYIKQRQGGGN